MEGSINEDSSIAETNVISKATAVVSNSTAQLLKATSNGQKVAVLTTGPRASTSSSSTINSNGRSSSPQTNNNNGRHHSNSSKSVPTVAQAIAVPGGMSIVQLLPNQTSNMVQSVIQPNHQSVIQAPNTTSLPLQLNNKLILVSNKGSVIQSTTDPHGEHHHQQQHNSNNIQLTGGGGNASGNGNGKDGNSNDSGSAGGDTAAALSQAMAYAAADEEAKRRREGLARRPSYRKILNDLTDGGDKSTDDDDDEDDGVDDPHQQQRHPPTLTLPTSYLKVLPASIQIGGGQDGGQGGISTIMTSSGGGGGGNGSTILQYASAHDGQFIVPADLQTYQLSRHPGQNVVMTTSSSGSLTPQIIDEASKKRELRLLKNREAAKECRRKKKEYIKCLENRVAVLENQNKALIDELKTLKELYCKKSD